MTYKNLFMKLIALLLLCVSNAYADIAKPWQFGFQEAATPVMEKLEAFHLELLYIITAIVIFVFLLLMYICVRFNKKSNPIPSKTSHNTLLEIVWTTIPIIILITIAIPSLNILYYMDKTDKPEMTLKVVGRQWYWQYEYPGETPFSFDSYLIKDEDIKPGQHRLLEVDNRVVLPVDTNVQVLITAADVMHSWAVPAFGVKTDAVPGRTNETWIKITKPGVYYGQCSELCGVGHGFMPIVVEAVSKEQFKVWLQSAKKKFAQVTNTPYEISSINLK